MTLRFVECPDEEHPDIDGDLDPCRGCAGYALEGGDHCGALWVHPDGTPATHREVFEELERLRAENPVDGGEGLDPNEEPDPYDGEVGWGDGYEPEDGCPDGHTG